MLHVSSSGLQVTYPSLHCATKVLLNRRRSWCGPGRPVRASGGALVGDDGQLLPLLGGEVAADLDLPVDGVNGARRPPVAVLRVRPLVAQRDPHVLERDPLPMGIHAQRHRGAGAEARQQQVVRRRPRVAADPGGASATKDVTTRGDPLGERCRRVLLLDDHDASRQWIGYFFDVTDPAFGAVGDGVTDDLPAILACRTAAIAAGVTTIYFPTPAAFYYVNGSVPQGPNDITYLGADQYRGRSAGTANHTIHGNSVDPVFDLKGTTAENRAVTFRYLSVRNDGAPCIDADRAQRPLDNCLMRSRSMASDLSGTVKLRRSPRRKITGQSQILASGGTWCLSARDDSNGLFVEEGTVMTGGSLGGACDISKCQTVKLAPTVETSKLGHRIAAGLVGDGAGNCTDIEIGGYLEAIEEPISIGVSTDGVGAPVIGFVTTGLRIACRIGNNAATAPPYSIRLGRVRAWRIDTCNLVRKTGGTEPLVLFEYSASAPSYAQGGQFGDNFWSGGPGDTVDVFKLGTTIPNVNHMARLIGDNKMQPVMLGSRSGVREYLSPTIVASAGLAQTAIVPASLWGGKIISVDVIEATGTLGSTVALGVSASATELGSFDPSTLTYTGPAGGAAARWDAASGAYWRVSEAAGTQYPLLLRVTAGAGTGSFRLRVKYRAL